MPDKPTQNLPFQKRIKIYRITILTLLFIVFIRIFFLQVIKGNKYLKLSLDNQQQFIPIPAYRGEIYDRNYFENKRESILAANKKSLNLFLIPAHIQKHEEEIVLKRVSHIINIPLLTLKSNYRKKQKNPYVPFLIKKDISIKDLAQIGELSNLLPGIYWEDQPYRIYPNKQLASHIIGNVGPITKNELAYFENLDTESYHMHSILGKSGIEKQYEHLLRGKEGKLLHVVDALNRIKSSQVIEKPEQNHALILTIDKRMQQIIEKAIKKEIGSVIIIKANTGEILAMASSPSFDPNIFLDENKKDQFQKLTQSKDYPFYNRAIQGRYAPSSTFKIVTVTAGLEEEVVNTRHRFNCHGYYKFENDDRIFHCWGIHRWTDIYRAIAMSCNVYCFHIGYELGSEKIIRFAKYYGFGKKSNIDLPCESRGFLPSHQWKKKRFREAWYDGDTINLAIGQGFLLVTPLQVANMMCGIANGGLIYRPHILKQAINIYDDKIVKENKPEIIENIPIKDSNLKIIRDGLRQVITRGTAKVGAQSPRLQIAGKTGTAQYTRGQPHAWFCGYAPYNKDVEDRIVICVMIEHGGGGGDTAAPVATAILRSIYYDEDVIALKKMLINKVQADKYDRYLRRKQRESELEEIDARKARDIKF